MRIIKGIAIRFFIALCRIFMPKQYFDDIYFHDFLYFKHIRKLKLKTRVWCFIRGFLPYEYVWYDLAHNDYRNYVPARNNYQKRSLNGAYNTILANKILFEKHIKNIINGIDKLHVVESIGFIEKGYLQPLHKDIIHGDFCSILPFLENSDLILKPISGDGGVGVFLVKKESNYFLFDNRRSGWDELATFLECLDDYLIQEKFVQHGFSNEIYAGSVNTMRIATLINPLTMQPFIAYAVHRFGSIMSGNIDNISRGGIAAMIDIKDGKLTEGQCFSFEGKKELYKLHPVSLKPIFNEKIPEWGNLTNRLIEMARRMPYFKYVGWDIILSNDELFVLEGNVSPHLDLVQMFKPMKDLKSAWDFFRYYKYI
jgi:hypothetical protein